MHPYEMMRLMRQRHDDRPMVLENVPFEMATKHSPTPRVLERSE